AKTCKDGLILVLSVHARNACDATWRELPPDARAALGYCSGWKRKRMSYGDWRKQKAKRGKGFRNG
ncbi:MAG: hypothetical protein V2A77_04505, partial [Pseudomonadota bacterium]